MTKEKHRLLCSLILILGLKLFDVACSLPSTKAAKTMHKDFGLGAFTKLSWSPNGKKVALSFERPSSIWILNSDGTGLTQIASGPEELRILKWSRSSRYLAYSTIPQSSFNSPLLRVFELMVMKDDSFFIYDVEKQENKKIDLKVKIAPDSWRITWIGDDKIVCLRHTDPPRPDWRVLSIVDIPSGHIKEVEEVSDTYPLLVTKNREIIYQKDTGIWLLDSAGDSKKKIYQCEESNYVLEMALTRDSKRLYFNEAGNFEHPPLGSGLLRTERDDRELVKALQFRPSTMKVLNLETGQVKELTKELVSNPNENYYPRDMVSSPDGRKVAFAVDHIIGKEAKTNILIMDADGRNKKILLKDYSECRGTLLTGWSYDSSKILFKCISQGPTVPIIVNVDTWQFIRMTVEDSLTYWSPTEDRIAVFSYLPNEKGISRGRLYFKDGLGRKLMTVGGDNSGASLGVK